MRSRELRDRSDLRRKPRPSRHQRAPRKRSRPAVVNREAETSARSSGNGSPVGV